MPPSAGACHTIDADCSPDCGRAADRSSIITAIGWRCDAFSLIIRPVSAEGNSSGVGLGEGVGVGVGPGVGDGPSLGAGVGEPPTAPAANAPAVTPTTSAMSTT